MDKSMHLFDLLCNACQWISNGVFRTLSLERALPGDPISSLLFLAGYGGFHLDVMLADVCGFL